MVRELPKNRFSYQDQPVWHDATFDLGLSRYVLQVYNTMAAGLAVSGVVGYFAVASGFYQYGRIGVILHRMWIDETGFRSESTACQGA